jgi:phosphate transport system ATP-binding protein
MPQDVHMESKNLVVRYGDRIGVGEKGGVNLPLYRHRVTALIGPSGCGKTTFLRA